MTVQRMCIMYFLFVPRLWTTKQRARRAQEYRIIFKSICQTSHATSTFFRLGTHVCECSVLRTSLKVITAHFVATAIPWKLYQRNNRLAISISVRWRSIRYPRPVKPSTAKYGTWVRLSYYIHDYILNIPFSRRATISGAHTKSEMSLANCFEIEADAWWMGSTSVSLGTPDSRFTRDFFIRASFLRGILEEYLPGSFHARSGFSYTQ